MKGTEKLLMLLGVCYLLCYGAALCRPHTGILGCLWAIVIVLLLIVLWRVLREKP